MGGKVRKMPNWCEFEMEIKGSRENVLKAVSILDTFEDCDEIDHSLRGHQFIARTGIYTISMDDFEDNHICYAAGECAWSMYACFGEGVLTYVSEHGGKPNKDGDVLVSLRQMSKELGLVIEAYSTEPDMGFAEHLAVNNGEVVIDDGKGDYEQYVDEEECKKHYLETYSADEIALAKERGYFGGYDQEDRYEYINNHDLDTNEQSMA